MSESMDGLELSGIEAALARSAAYELLSQVFLEGVSAEIHPWLDAIPTIERPAISDDEAAANHQKLFRQNVFPHESMFLDTTGLLGGEITETVRAAYASQGYRAADLDDHVGHELGMLAFLCAAEGDAWEDDRTDIAQQIRSRQRVFLQTHLLRWLPPLVAAIGRQPDRLYRELALLLWSMVGDHFADLQGADGVAWQLPEMPNLLGNDKTSLKDVANFVALPALSGVWIGAEELGLIGRKHDLPRGFGGRVQTMMNLFRSAIQFDRAAEYFGELAGFCNACGEQYAELSAESPALTQFVTPWQTRVVETETLLRAMQERLPIDSPDEPDPEPI